MLAIQIEKLTQQRKEEKKGEPHKLPKEHESPDGRMRRFVISDNFLF